MYFTWLKDQRVFLALVFIFALLFFAIAQYTDLAVYNTLRYTEEGLYKVKPTSFANLNLITLLPCLMGYALTYCVGYCVFQNIIKGMQSSTILTVLASFPLGLIFIIAVYRLFSYLLPSDWSYILVIVTCFLYIATHTADHGRQGAANSKNLFERLSLLRSGLIYSFFLIMFALALVMSVNMGDFTFVGHGPEQYAGKLIHVAPTNLPFPIFGQHYDEMIFHHWLTMPNLMIGNRGAQFNAIIPWWFTLALMKIGAITFLLLILLNVIGKPLGACASLCFIIFGTSSPDMTKYFMMFDANNPLFFTVHSGRVFSIYLAGLIIWLVAAVINENKQGNAWNRGPWLTLLLVGGGIASTSFSNVVMLIGVCLTYGLLRINYEKILTNFPRPNLSLKVLSIGKANTQSKINFVALLGIFLCVLNSSADGSIEEMALVLALWFFLCGPFLVYSFSSEVKLGLDNKESHYGSLILMSIGALVFSLLFGNILTPKVLNLFGQFGHWLGLTDTAGPIQRVIWGAPAAPQRPAILGDFRTIGPWYEGNQGPLQFITYYGCYFFIFALASVQPVKAATENNINLQRLRLLLLWSIFLMPMLFFFMEFTAFGYSSWVKSRFLEIPMWLALISSVLILFKNLNPLRSFLLAGFLLVYSIAPFIATGHLPLLVFNYALITTF